MVLLLVLLCASFALPASALDPNDFSDVSPEFEMTDPNQSHSGGATHQAKSVMVRQGDDLFFTYRTSPLDPNDRKIWIRRLHLDTETLDSAIEVSDDKLSDCDNNHNEPSLLNNGANDLNVFWAWLEYNSNCGLLTTGQDGNSVGTFTIPPRQRKIPDLSDPNTWSAPGGTPSRFKNEGFAAPPRFTDLQGVFDTQTNTTHFVGEGARFAFNFDGVTGAGDGLFRVYYQIDPNGAFSGPWMIVEADGHQPPNATQDGNIFTKGDIALGREPTGTRSLHLIWNIRNTFSHDPNGVLQSYQYNYNYYYARSDDGGTTWHSLSDPNVSRLIVDPNSPEHIFYNDPNFLEIEADVDQTGENSWDVDSQGRPTIAYIKRQTGGTQILGRYVRGFGATYDLVLARWDGAQWNESTIEPDFPLNGLTRLRVDDEDKIWVFADEGGFINDPNNDNGFVRYTFSTDNGANWSDWEKLSTFKNARRPWSYKDPLDSNFHYIAYQNRSTLRSYLRRMQLTPDADGDTITDSLDNCPDDANPEQTDLNGDGIGDVCELSATIVSVGADDGYVRESSETSGVGGFAKSNLSSPSALRIGDDKSDRQLKSVVSFDTSVIPVGATLGSATVTLVRGNSKGDPLASLGAIKADVQSGAFSGSVVLVAGDFEASGTALDAATTSENGSEATIVLDPAGLAAIDTSGTTQVRVHFDMDDDDDSKDDYLGYYSGENSQASNRPELVITYRD